MNIKFRQAPLTIGFLMMVFFTSFSNAEIYRWTDENGKVHFSDKPVGKAAKKLNIKNEPTKPLPEQSNEERKRKTEQYLRARKEEREEIEKKDREKKQQARLKKEKCREAKEKYKEITEAGAVYYKNKDGTRDYLGEERRIKEELRAKNEVKKWCG